MENKVIKLLIFSEEEKKLIKRTAANLLIKYTGKVKRDELLLSKAGWEYRIGYNKRSVEIHQYIFDNPDYIFNRENTQNFRFYSHYLSVLLKEKKDSEKVRGIKDSSLNKIGEMLHSIPEFVKMVELNSQLI